MAPHRKRQRQKDEDNEIVAVERASSRLRGGPDTHRRKRVSINGPSPKVRNGHRRDSTSSSSDSGSDEDMPDHDADMPNLLPATQYEIVRDGNFEHMEHIELDDQRATQRLLARQKKSGQVGNNLPAENAIIEEITCLNFMCHLNMHVKLGPLINFIVGENGSGKSAILTALSLCLGGKAAATNRGGSLKSFIKEGEESAVLMVRLKNQGDGAYQPDLFGESIIVERHFTKTGSAGFKLKNAAGRIISNKKSDVEDVIEYFQLQVDNPMNILTQDAAKTFITQSNSKTKYLFFYKGTQLEQLDNDYKTIYELIDGAEAKKPVLEENLKAVAAEMKEALRKVEIVDQHQEMRDEKRRLRKLYAWAQVEAEERSLEKLEEYLAASRESVEQAVQVLEQKSQQFAESEEAISALEEHIERLRHERDNVQDIENTAKDAQATVNEDVRRHHAESRKIQDELRAAKTKVKSCRHDVNEEQKRIEAADGGAHAQKLAAIEQANLQCTEAREKYESHLGNEVGLKTAIEIAGKELERAKEKLASKDSDISVARKRLDDIGRVGDPMAAFDPKIARLMETVRHDQGFQQTPVGPAGMHIKLLNLDWSFVLESMLGACLGGFVVTSKADQIRLAGMIRELNIASCPIFIVPRNSLGDITKNEPDAQFTTMLKVLELNDDLVRKLLIINFKAEQTLLIKDSQEATRIMFKGGKPHNVSSCLAINEQKPGMGWRYTYSGQSQVTDYVKGNTFRPLRMRTERENQVAFQKAAIERLDRERSVIDGECREAQQKLQRATFAHTQHKKLEQKLKIKMQKAQQNIENLKLDLDDSNIQDGKLEQLKIDLQEAEEEVALHENSFEQGVIERDRLNKIAKEKHEVVIDAKRNVAEAEAKLKKRQIKLNNIRDARSVALQEKNKAFEALDEAKSVAAKSEAKRDKQAERVTDFIAQAYEAVPTRLPLDEGMTVASIETTLSALTAQLNSYQKAIGGDDNKIREDAIKAKQKWDDLKAHTGKLERLIKALKKSLMLRLKLFRKFIRWISVAARSHFNLLLSERGFRGTMQLDHRAKLLEITVEPDETRKSAKGRGTKTLSGGEKSFSSICLLLSVWEAMGAPLRGLDEFDVFMDDINRDVSTKLLINGARDATGRQFIIISPKSISSGATEGAADVQIHKLIHPREQQRRITATGRLE